MSLKPPRNSHTPYHVGEAPVFDGDEFQPTNIATQAELDAVNTALDARVDVLEAGGGGGTASSLSNNGGTPFTVDNIDLSPALVATDTGTGADMSVNGEKVWLHQGLGVLPPPTFNNTGDNTAAVNAILTAAATSTGGKPAVVASGPGIIRCTGTVQAPTDVAFHGPGDQSLEFLWPSDLGAGNYHFKAGVSGISGRAMLQDVTLHFPDTPVNVVSLTPPSRADGLYTGRSSTIRNVYLRGNPRYGTVTDSDHQSWENCTLSAGWAAFAFLGTHTTYGDYYWSKCQMGGTMCNWYCESGTQMGGEMYGGHCGFGPIVMMMADGVSNSSITMRFTNAAVESFSEHLCLDPSGANPVTLKFTDCTAAGMYDSNVQFRLYFSTTVASDTSATGTYSLPLTDASNFPSRGSAYINGVVIQWTGKTTNTLTGVTGASGTLTAGTFIKPIYGDALVRGGALSNCDFSGNQDLFAKMASTPNGTVIRSASTLTDVQFGNVESLLSVCDAQDRPFADVSSVLSSVTARTNTASLRMKRRRNASPSVRKGDAVRVGLVSGGEYTERFQVIGAAVAGSVAGGMGAFASQTTANPIWTVISGMTNLRVQNVGDTLIVGTQSIPTDGSSTTTTQDVTLTGIVRTDQGSSLTASSGQTLRLQDPFGLPTSGRFSIGGKIVSYTGITGDQITGITSAASVGFVDTGIAIGRVVSVADASGFSSTGGLGLLNGQLVTYTGKSGSDILGINGGTAGVVTSGSTFAPKASLKVGSLRNFIAGVNSVQVGGHLYSIGGFQTEPIASTGATTVGYLLSPTLPASDGFASTISNNAVTVAGTQTNGVHGASPATLTVDSTTGFPSKGKIHAPDGAGGLVVGTYTGKSATTFTGCTWGAAPTIPDNTPITIAVALIVSVGDKWVRPAFATGQNNADDQGLVVEATSNLDSAGEAFAFSMAGTPDTGATVAVAVSSRFG